MEETIKSKGLKKFILDMILNMIAFGIYIYAQQIVLLPKLSILVTNEIYSSVVLYISIFNIICNVAGGELGNARIIRNEAYKTKNEIGDFAKILIYLNIIVTIIAIPIFIYLKYSIIEIALLILTMLFANVRLYSTCFYRIDGKFYKVIIQNVIYLVGIYISIQIFEKYQNIALILLIPEILSLIYALINSDLLKMKMKVTTEFKNTMKKYSDLGFLSFLTNLTSYFDKIFIYPLLGGAVVAIYYAVNSMTKIISLITNPMCSVILTWISKVKIKNADKMAKIAFLITTIIAILIIPIIIVLTYFAVKILYPQYLKESLVLMLPISIATTIDFATSLIKTILLKYCNTKKITISYTIYLILFIILGLILTMKYKIIGFAIANVISKMIMFILFSILLLKLKVPKEEENEYIKEGNE